MNDLSEQILETARSRNVKQVPRWRFSLTRILLGILFLVTIAVGALSFGLLWDSLWPDTANGMQGRGFKQMAIGALPFLWTGFLILLTGVGVFTFRNFRYGYRVRVPVILAWVIGLSLVCGIASYQLNLTFLTHRAMMQNVSLYRMAFEGQRRSFWVNPQAGRLAGDILAVSGTAIQIRDFSGKEWIIHFPISNPEKPTPTSGLYRFVGTICGNDFCAEGMRPWQARGGRNGGMGMHHQQMEN